MITEEQLSYKLFVGIDISKSTFDVALIDDLGKKLGHKVFKNNQAGFEVFLKWVIKFYQESGVVFCMEHTGVYSRLLMIYLQKHGYKLCMASGYVIRRSSGIIKGKNDKIDAYRIAEYAHSKRHKLEIMDEYDLNIIKLHDLLTTRARLVVDLKRITTPIEELKHYGGEDCYNAVAKACQAAIDGIKKSIKEIEKTINALIEEVPGWKERIELVTSIKGMGKIVCLWMIIYTKNFSAKINARQFASLVGIAPFEESSGSSIRKGSHVSHHSHKYIKGLLHACVMSAIRTDPKIKAYHTRKK